MADNEKMTKPKYEAPTFVALGELARVAGACVAGSGDLVDCTAGPLAQNACTDGATNNGATCSAGGSAAPTCTGGAAPG
jgi:hypothetical protein